MSGGHFDYQQFHLREIRDSLYDLIEKNEYGYPQEILEKFSEGLDFLAKAEIYVQRIDWLVSGDDGEESFLTRLANDLERHSPKKCEMVPNEQHHHYVHETISHFNCGSCRKWWSIAEWEPAENIRCPHCGMNLQTKLVPYMCACR